jgi:hypothetical protein
MELINLLPPSQAPSVDHITFHTFFILILSFCLYRCFPNALFLDITEYNYICNFHLLMRTTYPSHNIFPYLVGFGGLVVIVIDIGPKIRGFKPDRARWIFKGDTIRFTTSFEGR